MQQMLAEACVSTGVYGRFIGQTISKILTKNSALIVGLVMLNLN